MLKEDAKLPLPLSFFSPLLGRRLVASVIVLQLIVMQDKLSSSMFSSLFIASPGT